MIYPLKNQEMHLKEEQHNNNVQEIVALTTDSVKKDEQERKKSLAEKASVKEVIGVTLASLCIWEIGFAQGLIPVIARWARKQAFYEMIKKRSGNFTEHAQDDFTQLMAVGIHHTFAGLSMFLSDYLKKDWIYRYAAMLELAYEISDTSRIFLQLAPYKPGKVSFMIRFAMIAHHMPGLLTLIPSLLRGDHGNPLIRNLCGWLLFAAGSSAFSGAFIHTRDFDNPFQMKQAAFVHQIAVAMFAYTRFYMFPKIAYEHVEVDIAKKYGNISMEHQLARFVTLALTTFNLLVLKKNFTKSFKYLAKAVTNSASIDLNTA